MLFGSRGKPQFNPMGGYNPMRPAQAPVQQPVMQSAPPTDGVQGGMDAMQPKKPGVNWLGVLADALAGAAGQPGQYLAGIQQQQQRAAALADEQRRRSLDMTDWRAKQDYTRDNPAPADDVLTQMMRGGGIDPSSEQGVALYRQRAEALANPLQFRPDGLGGGKYVSRQPEHMGGSELPEGWTIDKEGGGVGDSPGGFRYP